MRSILFSLGDFPIRSFGVCIALGLVCAHFVISRLGRREGMAPEFAANLVTLMILSGLVGARAAYVMEHWTAAYAAHPAAALRVWEGGLMFYGGFVLAVAAALVYIRLSKLALLPVLDMLATALPLAHALGRVGCFLNGCCHGRVAGRGEFGMRFPQGSIPFDAQVASGDIYPADAFSLPVVPAQLYEAALNLGIFALLLALAFYPGARRLRPGVRAGLYMALYAPARFFVEGLRADERMTVGVFSISQFISLFVFAAGLALMAFAAARRRAAVPVPVSAPALVERPRARMAEVFKKR